MDQRKLKCLMRLNELNKAAIDDLYLKLEMILNDNEKLNLNLNKKISSEIDKFRELMLFIFTLQSNNRVLLLDFEWSILPEEYIKITMVTTLDMYSFSNT